ncbi:MAG: hypothetical protein ACI8ZM_001070 [Crocinitomix sp.]|jgi:hypothetical protein
MQKKQKTNLFRFVTLRAPQLISADRRALGFIDHPDPDNSDFLGALTGLGDDINVRRAALTAVIVGWGAYDGVSDVKAISSDLWDFSLWLSKNKNKLVRSELDALIPSPLPSSAQMLALWDNLFYDILTKKNAPLRQACLQTIVAVNFINEYVSYSPGITTDEAEILAKAALLKRLANGKVIVDRAFTVEKTDILSAPIGAGSKSYVRHVATHKANLSRLDLAPLEALKQEFCSLEKQYSTDSKAAHDLQFGAYKSQVKNTVDQYISQNSLQGDDIEDQLPFGLVDEFVLSFDAPLSATYTQGKLSSEALAYLAIPCIEEEKISDVMKRIDAELQRTKQAATPKTGRKVSEVLIKGVATRPSSSVHHDYAFTLQDNQGSQGGNVEVYLTITAGFDGAFLKTPDFKLTVGATDHSHTDLDIISSDQKNIFLKLSFGTLSKINKNEEFVFNGDFDLSNGKTMTMTRSGIGGMDLFSGTVFTVRNANGQVELYGVNRIGVADYRKVEQELCCYVAGEVSHIENILAKEYKEKSTRQLTRSESSFESKSEREIEELTDTTTATRHEMSSEVSEVVNKDRQINLGFNTGANGKHPTGTWNASANGSFAFGNSTSNSDSEAKTYAEDVTQRALERIVQKTSLTRTSKILKEFEENNKHGFDNREGENHVTGIYRWVDKVYKNRIVNYGKRLMYEFMIPEPAKFYKEAIIVQVEEEESITSSDSGNDDLIAKPTHPKDNGIENAKSITRANYLEKMALYGADATPPMDRFKDASESYGQSIGNGNSEHTFDGAGIQVPIQYHCISITGVLAGSYQAKSHHSAYLKLSAGGNWQITGLTGHGVFPVDRSNITISGLNLENTINVKINTRKVVTFNFTLTAKCELNASDYLLWQQDVYSTIMQKYEQQLQAYKDAQAAAKAEAEVTKDTQEEETVSNSGFNSEIMTTELKRLCIEMITQPFGIDQGKDFYKTGACDIPSLSLTDELDSYSSHIKFFEQAFDWELMSSLFYPYYWAKKCDWKALFQSNDGNDHVFRAFLRSGMGRVVVPVREGFEDAVTYFMETGEIWSGIGLAISTDDELYLSIMDETTLIEGEVEGQEWETVVPSTLTIVQARSALLDEEGLPCCETDEEVLATMNIKADTNTLSLKSDPPA